MIEFDGLSFSYTPDAPSVLTDVEATVHDGEFVLVAGRTGSGKSTLLGTINGLVPTFTGGHLDGDVRVDGVSIRDRAPRAFSHLVGYVGQDPLSGFVTDTVEDELAYGMEQLGLDAQVMRRRVEETLDLLGIASLRRRALRTLSGGQQQRIAIGSVLTMHPKVLVLDEPTSALDPTAAEEVLATLARLVTDLGTTVVLAEHRLERVIPFVDSMMVIDGSGRVEVGPAAELLTRSPIVPPITELARLARWEPLPLTVRDARRLACGLTARLAGSRPSPPPHRAATEMSAAESNPALEASGIVVRYGSNVAVRNVDLHVDRGEIVALMGRNGSGKSSLLWAIQGSGPSEAGRVSIGGVDPRKLDAPARRKRVGLVPQSASDLLYLDTVEAECATADDESGAPSGSCAALLERLTPGIDAHRHPRDLSEGQRLALVVAIQLTASPQVVLLDEPTRGLDYPAKRVVTDLVRSLADEGRSVIVASHDVELVAAMADRVVVMAQGEIVTDAPTVEALCGSPAFSPQTTKILGAPWLTVDQVRAALAPDDPR